MMNKLFAIVFMSLLSACGDKDEDTATDEEPAETGQTEEESEESESSEGEDTATE